MNHTCRVPRSGPHITVHHSEPEDCIGSYGESGACSTNRKEYSTQQQTNNTGEPKNIQNRLRFKERLHFKVKCNKLKIQFPSTDVFSFSGFGPGLN